MSNNTYQGFVIGKYLTYKRKKLKLKKSEFVKQMGYKNINKGIRRLNDLESGIIHKEYLQQAMLTFDISEEKIEKCRKLESKYKNRYIKKLKPFEPHLIVGTSKWTQQKYLLDKSKTIEENLELAKKLSKKYNHVAVLCLNYHLRYYVYGDQGYTKSEKLKK